MTQAETEEMNEITNEIFNTRFSDHPFHIS